MPCLRTAMVSTTPPMVKINGATGVDHRQIVHDETLVEAWLPESCCRW